jgi:hypothetical protein
LCNMPCAEHEAPHEHAQVQEQPIHFHVKPTA